MGWKLSNLEQTEGLKEVEEAGIDVICGTGPYLPGRTEEND